MLHDTEQWCKIWINLDFVVSKIAWGVGWTFIRALKSLKNCTLMGSFYLKHIMLQPEKFQRNYVPWNWRVMQNLKGKLTRGLKNDIRNLVSFPVSNRKSENLHFDGLLLSKTYKVLDEKVQKSYAVTYLEFFWADRYIHRAHEGATMVGADQKNSQNLYLYILLKCTPRPCLFLEHFPNYLNLHYETLLFVDDFYKIHTFILRYSSKKNCMAINLWELRSNLRRCSK